MILFYLLLTIKQRTCLPTASMCCECSAQATCLPVCFNEHPKALEESLICIPVIDKLLSKLTWVSLLLYVQVGSETYFYVFFSLPGHTVLQRDEQGECKRWGFLDYH